MISKEQFVNIIRKLQLVDDFVEETNDKARQLRDDLGGSFSDFFDSHTLFVAHDDLVVNLLENIFDNDMISYWIYELDYGRKYEDGRVQDVDGKIIDISTCEKLYDYLIKEMEE